MLESLQQVYGQVTNPQIQSLKEVIRDREIAEGSNHADLRSLVGHRQSCSAHQGHGRDILQRLPAIKLGTNFRYCMTSTLPKYVK